MAKLKCDAVFEGGGVKGIGLVGAVKKIEEQYEFVNMAGTSAGAIVAALLAAGYSGDEIEKELIKLNYNDFKDEGLIDKLGLIGKGISLGFEFGIYEGDFFEKWLAELLKKRNVTVFGDIKYKNTNLAEIDDERYSYRFQAIATDITDRNLLVLPGDLKQRFGIEPDNFSVARAVRMSMSIPIFFEPVKLPDINGHNHYIVDGGVLSNYPIWLLDSKPGVVPEWPTFGFKLVEPDERKLSESDWNPVKNAVSFLKALIGTMMDAHDNYHISVTKGDFKRTIGISSVADKTAIQTTDFNITQEQSKLLYQNGINSATSFLEKWDFDKWKNQYRPSGKAAGQP